MLAPQTEQDLAETIKSAQAALSVQGGGTRGFAPQGEALSTRNLAGVSLYEPGALTLVAQSGTPLAEIETVLAQDNQRLAFEPMDHRTLLGSKGTPTLGGVMASNASGPRRLALGAARDFALGVRFVDGAGQIIKNGGRVMKNVTGYDLVKLLCGSWGTLGVMTEISLKVLPMTETSTTLRLHNVDRHTALEAMTRATNSPFETTGAAYVQGDALLRLEGFESSVAYRAQAMTERLAGLGEISLETDQDGQAILWRRVRDVDALKDHPLVWRVSLTPSAMVQSFLPHLERQAPVDVMLDWAGGLAWVGVSQSHMTGTDLPDLHRVLQSSVANPSYAGGGGGHATLVKAPAEVLAQVARFQPEPAALAALSAGLRAKFDPHHRLNAGLMEQVAA